MFLSIDLDAFYCGVEEHIHPKLRDEEFCVVQKHCIATLSYPARKLGLKKLDNVHHVKEKFPNLIMVNGEDLSKYRKAGNDILKWTQHVVYDLPVERLGIEEMRIDISPIVADIKASLLPLSELQDRLKDPDFMDEVAAKGITLGNLEGSECPEFFFSFDGNTWPPGYEQLTAASDLDAYIAGHFACYLRDRMWLELGYSCSIGVASSKNLAKMVGAYKKPRGVSVLQPGHEKNFMKAARARQVPGLGKATREALGMDESTTIEDILLTNSRSVFISRVAPVSGSKAATSLWELINGNDVEGHTIKNHDAPTQVSVEETYSTYCPSTLWFSEVKQLCSHLIRQTVVDWYDEELCEWKKIPETCRLSLIFANKGYVRRIKTRKYSWNIYDSPEMIGSDLPQIYYTLLQELVKIHDGMPRMINVALVSQNGDKASS